MFSDSKRKIFGLLPRKKNRQGFWNCLLLVLRINLRNSLGFWNEVIQKFFHFGAEKFLTLFKIFPLEVRTTLYLSWGSFFQKNSCWKVNLKNSIVLEVSPEENQTKKWNISPSTQNWNSIRRLQRKVLRYVFFLILKELILIFNFFPNSLESFCGRLVATAFYRHYGHLRSSFSL